MRLRLNRRAALLLPLWLASCGDDDVPAPTLRGDFPPLRYNYLPPISLNVQRVEIAGDYVLPQGDLEIIGSSPVNPIDTLYAMARDRLKPVAADGAATFRILMASIIRRREKLDGVLAVRLDVHNAGDTATGYTEARVTAAHTGLIRDQRAIVYEMLRSMMENLNVELEYQLRNKLRAWIIEPSTAPSQYPSPPQPLEPPEEGPSPV
jgi:hypothetical protein